MNAVSAISHAVVSAMLLTLVGCSTSPSSGTTRRAAIEDIGQKKSATAGRSAVSPPASQPRVAPPAQNSDPSALANAAPPTASISGRDFAAAGTATGAASANRDAPAPRGESVVVAPPPALLAKLEPLPAQALPVQSNRAVAALLDSAAKQAREGRTDAAVATLERALGIEPGNGLVWSRLAELHLRQAHYPQAVQMATKSNVLVTQPALLAHNWRILALAREATGDLDGAREANQQAAQFESRSP